jgi:GAF domain-containing protein
MNSKEINYYHKLYELASEINSATSRDKVIQSIVVGICTVIGSKGCSLMLLTPDRKSLVHSVSVGLSNDFLDAGPRSIDKSLPETVGGNGKVAFIYDLAKEKDRVQYPDAALKEGIVSIMAVPVKLREDIIGEIRIYSATPRRFTDEEIYFIQAVVNLGAIAMENIRLYESCQRAYDLIAASKQG